MFRVFATAVIMAAALPHLARAGGPYASFLVDGQAYSSDGGNFDSYLPESPHALQICIPSVAEGQWGGPFPALVLLHGGYWVSGSIYSLTSECQIWASYGFVVFNAQYTLLIDKDPNTFWPRQLIDVQAAVRWVRANAWRYNANPNYVVAKGDSAGAHLADFLGWMLDTYHFAGDTRPLQWENPGYSSRVQAVVSEFGPTTWGPDQVSAGATSGAPLPLLSQNPWQVASTLFVQGTFDTVVNPNESYTGYTSMLSLGRTDAAIITYPGGHEFLGMSSADRDTVRLQEIRFLLNGARYWGAFPN